MPKTPLHNKVHIGCHIQRHLFYLPAAPVRYLPQHFNNVFGFSPFYHCYQGTLPAFGRLVGYYGIKLVVAQAGFIYA